MAVDLDRTTTEAGAYPVVLLSYLIACQTYDDAGRGRPGQGLPHLRRLTTEGQQAAAGEAGSAPLDSGLQDEALEIVATISAG